MAPVKPRFQVLKETLIKPSATEHREEACDLNGFDVSLIATNLRRSIVTSMIWECLTLAALCWLQVLLNHMNVRLVYFFEEMLPVPALKVSLAEALTSFPLLTGRSRVRSGKHHIKLSNEGALVREQRATFFGQDEGGLDSPSLRPHLDGFVGPERFSKAHGGHMLTITFTEICHSEGFACAPPTACKDGLQASQAENWSGRRPIKYALGVRYAGSAGRQAGGWLREGRMADWWHVISVVVGVRAACRTAWRTAPRWHSSC